MSEFFQVINFFLNGLSLCLSISRTKQLIIISNTTIQILKPSRVMFSFRVSCVSLLILTSAAWLPFSVRANNTDNTKYKIETYLSMLAERLLEKNISDLIKTCNTRCLEPNSESVTPSSIGSGSTRIKGRRLFNLMIYKGIVKALKDFKPIFKEIFRPDLEHIIDRDSDKYFLAAPLNSYISETSASQDIPPTNHNAPQLALISRLEEEYEKTNAEYLKIDNEYQECQRKLMKLERERLKAFHVKENIERRLKEERDILNQTQALGATQSYL
jgi:hypothetical protein